jgi:hypothetical protein
MSSGTRLAGRSSRGSAPNWDASSFEGEIYRRLPKRVNILFGGVEEGIHPYENGAFLRVFLSSRQGVAGQAPVAGEAGLEERVGGID